MRSTTPFVFLFCLCIGFGCAGLSPRAPVPGVLFSDVAGPEAATSNQNGSRAGEACVKSILGLVATGDASIETARRNGGITMITSVDVSFANYLGVFSKYCTIVRGH